MPDILSRRDFPGRLPRMTKLVDRTTKWGNPFIIGEDGDRATVVVKHRDWIVTQPALMNSLGELTGYHLMCWCEDHFVERGLCHAVTLRDLANGGVAL